MKNPYWERISALAEKQRQKGIDTYGQGLEDNQAPSAEERIEYIQEELIDALMYLEWFKDKINNEKLEQALNELDAYVVGNKLTLDKKKVMDLIRGR